MYRLNLPQYDIKIRENHGRYDILDILRRKYVALTPEEWVRQHFIHYLIEHKGYPAAYLTNEIELKSGVKRLRCDSVLYDTSLRPRMIIEYKAPSIELSHCKQRYATLLLQDGLCQSEIFIFEGHSRIQKSLTYGRGSYFYAPPLKENKKSHTPLRFQVMIWLCLFSRLNPRIHHQPPSTSSV